MKLPRKCEQKMTDVKLRLLYNNIWNHLTVCKIKLVQACFKMLSTKCVYKGWYDINQTILTLLFRSCVHHSCLWLLKKKKKNFFILSPLSFCLHSNPVKETIQRNILLKRMPGSFKTDNLYSKTITFLSEEAHLTVIGGGNESMTKVQILDKPAWVSLLANALGKCMDPFILLPAMNI